MTRFVLDASVVLAWFLHRPTAPYAAHIRQLLLRGSRAVVPTLWPVEIANAFVVAERRGLSKPSDTTEALQNLDIIAQAVETSQDTIPMRGILGAAREFRLTAYDAVYLEDRAPASLTPGNARPPAVSGCFQSRSRNRFVRRFFDPSLSYFRYSELFLKSSGTLGNGGNSCEYPFSRLTATSARRVPS